MAAGTKVGTGYVAIEPDFSGFQEEIERALRRRFSKVGDDAGRDFSAGITRRLRNQRDGFGLGAVLAPLVKRFEKAGDQAGKVLADRIGKGAGRAKGDTFGLAAAIAQVEKNSTAAARNLQGLERDMFGIGRAAKTSGRNLISARTSLGAWHTEAGTGSRVTRTLAGRLGGLSSRLREVTSGARSAAGGFGGMNGAMARVNRGAQFFRNITRLLRFPALITGLGLLTQGLAALAAGFVAAGSSIGTLAGGLVALPALAATAAQAFGALKLATAGIGDTIKAALDAQVKGGSQAVDTMGQQRAAADRVADAEFSLADAQRQTKITQDDLTAARKDARRELEDMALAAERTGSVEEEGALRLRQLREQLLETALDPDSTELDIRLDENALKQAQLDLKQTRIEAKRTRADYKDAADEGVKGMPAIVAARRAEADASRAETAAQRDLQRAVEASTEQMGAQGAAADKLAEEMGQLPPAAQAFVRQIISLKPKLDQLRATAASGLFPGVSQGLRSVMGNFGVVNRIVGQTSTAFGGLAAKAGEALGGKEWGRDLQLIGRQNVRTINQMGAAGGNLADTFRHLLVAARPFVNWLGKGTVALTGWIKTEAKAGRESGRLAAFFDRTKQTMQLLGPILKGVGGAFLNIGKAARPLGNEILGALGRAAEGWRKWTGSVQGQNSLRKYFADAKPAIFEMGRLLRDVTKAFFEIGNQPGAAPLIKQVRTQLLPALTDVVRTLTGALGQALVSTFTSVVKLVEQLSKVNGPLVTIVKGVGALAAGLAFAIDKIPGVDILVSGILGAVVAIKAWTVAQRLLNVAMSLNPIGAVVVALAGLGFALYTAWTKSETFRKIVTGAFDAVVSAGKFLADKYLGYITTILGGFSSLVSAGSKLPFVGGKFKGLAGAIDSARDEIDGFRESLRGGNRDASRTAGLKAQQTEVDRLKNKLGGLKKGTREYKETAERLRAKSVELKKALEDIKPAAGKAGSGINTLKGNVGNLGGGMGTVAEYTQSELNKILREFGAKPIKHKAKPFPKLVPLQQLKRQRGGPINVGAPSGDSVPALLERDEYVLNRKAVKTVGRATLDAINFGMAPRFQKGGAVGDIGGLSPGALKLAAILGNRYGQTVSSGRRAGDTDSIHSTGNAIDTTGGDWRGAARYVNSIGPSLLEGIYNPAVFGGPPVSWDSGQQVPHGFWDADWGRHMDHIHSAVGASFKAVATQIKRLLITGGTKTTNAALQGASDRLIKGANQYIESVMPRVSHSNLGPTMSGDGDVEATFAKIAKRLSKSKIATLALGMAGYAESGMEDLYYGDRDSQGALQVRAGVHPGVDPHNEGQIASLFLNSGFTGRGGANVLAAQGLPAHLVAQAVQGSFDPTGSNYLRQEGAARAWMKRFGLKKGGLVGMVGDSLGVGTAPPLRERLKTLGLGLRANVQGSRPSTGAAGMFNALGLGKAAQYVFDLGTNDTSVSALKANLAAVDRTTGDSPLHALTVLGDHAREKNAALRSVAGANIIDWAKIAGSYVASDPMGLHPTGAGYSKRAELLKKAIKAAAPKKPAKPGGSTVKGGIGSPLGEIDVSLASGRWNLPQAIHKSLQRTRRPQSKKGTRRKQIAGLVKRLKDQYSLDGWAGEGLPGLAGRIAGFDGDDEYLADQISRADSQTFDVLDADDEPVLDPDGRQVVSLGRMDGKTAGQWASDRLQFLLERRNDFIEARARVTEMLADITKRLEAMRERAAFLKERIAQQMDVRLGLGDLVDAKRRPNKLKAKIERLAADLAPKLNKFFPKNLWSKKVTAKLLREEPLGRSRDRIGAALGARNANLRERNAIVRQIIPTLTDRHELLTGDQETYLGALTGLQGRGRGDTRGDKFSGTPVFGQFSGSIFDAHQQLNEMNTPPPIIKRDKGEADNSRNLDRELFNQQYGIKALEELQKRISEGATRLVPFGGVFHEGGKIPGPVGQERMILAQSGEGVIPLDKMHDLRAPSRDGMTIQLIVEDGAVDESKIKAIARDQAGREYQVQTKRERSVMRMGARP